MLLIGGGSASASAAAELRRLGYDGPVTLLTRELQAPYHRPPLSKNQLRGESDTQFVHAPDWWKEHDVELITRAPVLKISTADRAVQLANKASYSYDKALVATGAMVRRLQLPGATLGGVHYLRAPMNADQLRLDLADGPKNVVLVGGSFIGVEVAASLATQGHHCTLVMMEDHCLQTTFGATVGRYVQELLQSRGVRAVCRATVAELEGDERVTHVRTADGSRLPADVVVIGAGAVPDVKLARSSGLSIGETGGIACNPFLRTSDAHVFAAGDACEYDSPLHGRRVRIEHERHAEAQGETAARNMLGQEVEHLAIPYFWTDIADWVTLEYVGVSTDFDTETVEGDLTSGVFTVWYTHKGNLVGALTSGRQDDLRLAEERITARTPACRRAPGKRS